MEKAIGKSDYGVCLARLTGTLLIIGCHIAQFFGSELAWWLNCGVTLFLCLSGFLYGQKEISDGYIFIRKRFVRILKEYYVCVAITLGIYLLFAVDCVNIKGILDLIFCNGTIAGLGHLWFIGTILFCNLLTPFFSRLLDDCYPKRGIGYIGPFCLLILLHIIMVRFIPHFGADHVVCYFFGFTVGRIKKTEEGGAKKICIAIIFLCFIMNSIRIYINYFTNFEFSSGLLTAGYRWFCNYAHVMLGSTVLIVTYAVGNWIKITPLCSRILKLANEYSFDVYLAHNMWLNTSPVCIWNLSITFLSKVLLIVVMILSESVLIHWISGKLRIEKRNDKNYGPIG